MKRIEDGNYLVFESGREIYANRGIIGIAADEVPTLFHGYDGQYDVDEFTKEERQEIAAYMIELWKGWAT